MYYVLIQLLVLNHLLKHMICYHQHSSFMLFIIEKKSHIKILTKVAPKMTPEEHQKGFSSNIRVIYLRSLLTIRKVTLN